VSPVIALERDRASERRQRIGVIAGAIQHKSQRGPGLAVLHVEAAGLPCVDERDLQRLTIRLTIGARTAGPLEEARTALEALGAEAQAVAADVTTEAGCRAIIEAAVARFGGIDVLVNNAALYSALKPRPFNEWDSELWDRVMAINVRGTYLMVRHVAPHMMARRSGKIINIASGAPYKGVPHMLPYVTSKGAILAFTRSLSRELGEYGIAVNSLSPGYTLSDTGLANTAHAEDERIPVRNSRAFKRDETPEDLLGALVFLASSDSDFVTGQSLVVDGGSVNN